MNPDSPSRSSFSTERRLGVGMHVGLSILAVAGLLLMVNYLAARHFERFSWTSDARYQLSEATRAVLGVITNEVEVTLLFDRDEPLFSAVSGLLKEYSYANPKIRVEHVDYKRDISRAETVIARYQLPQSESDLVIFDVDRRTKMVRANELSDYNIEEVVGGEREIRRVTFKGERLFTSAIISLIEGRSPRAYFLRGHGEHDPARSGTQMGYAKFARLLQQQSIRTAYLSLIATNRVPDDCSLLIVAGPATPLEPVELTRLGEYLNRGGRMLVLLSYWRSRNAPTGIERLLADWGVVVGDNCVGEPRNTVSTRDVVCTNFTAHPIVKPLVDRSLYLVLPRSVEPAPARGKTPDAPRVMPLILSSTEAYVTTDFSTDGMPKRQPLRDRVGVVPLAVAVEKGNLQGVGADVGSTRIVVVGESIFLGNETIEKLANSDLANLTIGWLLDRPQALTGLLPRPIQEYEITLTRSQMARARLLLLLVLPGLVIGCGVAVWARRRR